MLYSAGRECCVMTELSPKVAEAAMVATGTLVTIAWVTFLYLVGASLVDF